jgi:tRNA-Thr(GGU) m(6)t(6)A37 methyltransferase TsaA
MSTRIEMQAIGVVRTAVPDGEVARRRREIRSTIVVFDDYAEGLAGIEAYSHLFVLFRLDRATASGPLLAHPRGDPTLPLTGVFAARGRNHPNAIGLAVVELLARRGAEIDVLRLDAYDGTPVLDLKPYDDYDVVPRPRVPAWFRQRAVTGKRDLG